MKHPPIEPWYCEIKKAEIQPQNLERHLTTCSYCLETYQAWQEVERALLRLPLHAPTSGFANRWQSYARVRSQQTQEAFWKWSVGLVSVALLVIASMVTLLILFFDSSFVTEMISNIIRMLSRLPLTWLQLRYAFTFWLREIPPYWIATFGLFLYAWTILPLGTWLYAFIKFTSRGVKPS